MPWTALSIATAMILGFFLGVMLMALLGMARASEEVDTYPGRLAIDRAGVRVALHTPTLDVLSTGARK